MLVRENMKNLFLILIIVSSLFATAEYRKFTLENEVSNIGFR